MGFYLNKIHRRTSKMASPSSYVVVESHLYNNALVMVHGNVQFCPGVPVPRELESSFQEFANSVLPKQTTNVSVRVPSCVDFLSELSKHGYNVVSSCVTSNQNEPHMAAKMFWTLEKKL